MEHDSRRQQPNINSEHFCWKITLLQLSCLPNCRYTDLAPRSGPDQNQRQQERQQRAQQSAPSQVQLRISNDHDQLQDGLWNSYLSREAILVVLRSLGEDAEYSSSSTVTLIVSGSSVLEHHPVADVSVAWPQVECFGEQDARGCRGCVLLADYGKITTTEGKLKIPPKNQDSMLATKETGSGIGPLPAFQTKTSPSLSEKNPNIGKTLSTVPNLVKRYMNRASVQQAVTGTTDLVSQGAATESFSNREEPRGNPDGEVLPKAGGEANPQQSSSPFNLVHGPPRFSQLLAQSSLSRPPLDLKATPTRTPSGRIRKRKFKCPDCPDCEAAVSFQDDNHQGAPLRKANLREQIVACLLEPDFEDFVAEVVKVWDEIEGTISNDMELQGHPMRLQKNKRHGLSRYFSNENGEESTEVVSTQGKFQ